MMDNDRFFIVSEIGFKNIANLIRKGNPPEGMDKEEWLDEISHTMQAEQDYYLCKYIVTTERRF